MTYLNSDSVTYTGIMAVMHLLLVTKSRFLHYTNNWTGFRYTIRSLFPHFCCSFYTIGGLLRRQGAKKTGKAPDGSSYLDCAEKDEIKKLLM